MSRIIILAAISGICCGLWGCTDNVLRVTRTDLDETKTSPIEIDEETDDSDTPDLPESSGDSEPPQDTVPEPIEPQGNFMDPCLGAQDCDSGFCVQFGPDYVCTQYCAGNDCPSGWSCKNVINSGADVVFICVPDEETLCQPCSNNLDCGQFGDMCIEVGGQMVCGRDCSVSLQCPEDYHCSSVIDQANAEGMQCVHNSESCACRPDQIGESRPCVIENQYGTCEGIQYCTEEEGWTSCSAAIPAIEVCDGIDNDCDNSVDEELPEQVCYSEQNEIGICEGLQQCDGVDGWVCNARPAAPEVCDGLDNDCNGMIDENMLPRVCFGPETELGICEGSETCMGAQGWMCDAGSSQLEECNGVDDDCNGVVDDGMESRICSGQPNQFGTCEGNENCLGVQGWVCDAPMAEEEVCDGVDNNCSGVVDDGLFSRPCASRNEFGTCEGEENCAGLQGWVCNAQPASPEVCDGVDNECNGVIDDGFNPRPCTSQPNEIGVCQGTERCLGDQGMVCDARIASVEICDGLDNNCNGIIDDGICYDGNDCTDDMCDPNSGNCIFPPKNGPCDDMNPCTVHDHCESGGCTGAAKDCDDNNSCTADYCVRSSGACRSDSESCPSSTQCTNYHVDGRGCCAEDRLNGVGCDDDDACTVGDRCSNGRCLEGQSACSGQTCSNCNADWLSMGGWCLELFGSPVCMCICI